MELYWILIGLAGIILILFPFLKWRSKFWQALAIMLMMIAILSAVDMAEEGNKGKPIEKLKDGAIYTTYAQTDEVAFRRYAYMILGDEQGKEPKLYKILGYKLRDLDREPFYSPPRKFKVKRGTIESVEGTGFHKEGKTREVYFIIPVE